MQFSKVKITKDDEVELTHADVHKFSRNDIETKGVNPLPSFKDAVKAFLPLFLRIVPQLEEVKDNLRVSTLTLGEKDGDRSLQISAVLSIDACHGAGISMTTPRITTPPEGATDDQIYLSPAERRLIHTLEAEAEKYFNGETAQGEIFTGASENTKAADARMAAGEASTTRKPARPRRGQVAGNIGGTTSAPNPGEVVNPMHTVKPMTDGELRQALLSVERDVSEAEINKWTATEREHAQAWVIARQKEILGQVTDTKVPAEPKHVIEGSSLRIGTEQVKAAAQPHVQ